MKTQLIDRAVALLVPPRCVACRGAAAAGRSVCRDCNRELNALPCGERDSFSAAAFPYEGVARQMVAALKFEGAVGAAGEMAEAIVERLPGHFGDATWIVPVPAHPSRRRSRGYNQSKLLAGELARLTGVSCIDCLMRQPAGRPPQSELSREARMALPRGEFKLAMRKSFPEVPTNVVICDDVRTTGVTLEVCAQAIRERQPESGSGQVRAVAFAGVRANGPTDRIARRQSRRPSG